MEIEVRKIGGLSMKNILNHKATKVLAAVLCGILPVALMTSVTFTTSNSAFIEFLWLNLYNLLWCGFYGCLLTWLSFKSKWIKALAIGVNLLAFSFLAFGSLMGGLSGPFILLAKAVIPFLPL